VTDYLLRFEEAGLTWPAAATLDDATLERKLFGSSGNCVGTLMEEEQA